MSKNAKSVYIFLLTSGLGFSVLRAGAVFSNGSGNWSSPAIWTPASPASTDTVTILSGHTVTIDLPTVTVGTTTVSGRLRFSPSISSTFTLTKGNLVVNSGGVVEMGTSAQPIPAGVNVTLILARGTTGGQYGLVVNDGGQFKAFGSPKGPVAEAAQSYSPGSTFINVQDPGGALGWAVGDEITIGKTSINFGDETERRRITGLSSPAPDVLRVQFSTSLAFAHVAASTVTARVAVLTRNVVIRSSGTSLSTDSAYIRILATAASAFEAVHTEFAYLGGSSQSSNRSGIALDGAGTQATISSCTIREGHRGIYSDSTQNNVFSHNVLYKNGLAGIYLQSDNTVVFGNDSFSNGAYGIFTVVAGDLTITANSLYANGAEGISMSTTGGKTVIASNRIFSNGSSGLRTNGGAALTVMDNRVSQNRTDGMRLTATRPLTLLRNESSVNSNHGIWVESSSLVDALLAGNDVHDNGDRGIFLDGSSLVRGPVTMVDNSVHGNSGWGLYIFSSTGVVFADGRMGYSPSGAPHRDGPVSTSASRAFTFASSMESLVMRRSQVLEFPTTITGLSSSDYVLSYNQNFDTGTLRLHGHYTQPAGGAFALEHNQQLHGSSVTPPRLMRGVGHAAAVCSTVDGNAVSQLVTIERAGGVWTVTGSSSGSMGVIMPGGGCPGTALPSAAAQVSLALTEGASPQDGDRLDFILLAASNDAGRRKKLLFGNGFSGTASQLTMPTGTSLVLRGVQGQPAIVDRQSPSGAYYALVSSGAATLENVQVQNANASGLQLSGAGPVSISSAVFDFMGISGSTSAYITAVALSSVETFTNVSFLAGRLPAGGQSAYNVLVQGPDTGLSWTFQDWTGPLSGPAFEFDLNHRVRWADGMAPGAVANLDAQPLGFGGVRLIFSVPGGDGDTGFFLGAWKVFHSTDLADLAAATTTQAQTVVPGSGDPGMLESIDVAGLALNATYYFQLWSEDESANLSAPSNPAQAVPMQAPPSVALSVSSLAGGRVPRGALFQAGFDMAMDAASVAGAMQLRRVRDGFGAPVDEPAAGSVAADITRTLFTFTPDEALSGNSLYEFRVEAGALAENETPLPQASSASYTTVIDRRERNVLLAGGVELDVSPGALAADGFIDVQSAPASPQAAAATEKITGITGDDRRRPIGGLVEVAAFDEAGMAQPGALLAPALVSVAYGDIDGNGIVDGTQIRAKTLALYRLDEQRSLWERLPSTVDLSAKRVVGRTRHLSLFAAMGQLDTDLGAAYAYPIPYRAKSGTGGITFAGLGEETLIEIFTMDGARVAQLRPPPGGAVYVWDVLDSDGKPVASGVYWYVLKSGDNVKKDKLVIIR